MIRSRQGSLLLGLALLGAALVLRLFEVQIVEHELWAGEASRLVHSGREIPYRRGRILDARGRVLARDEDQRGVELVYREFRRGHPLGQVAHARSLLEGRPVPLGEARAHLVEWARELVMLRPDELRAFARGEGLAATAAGGRPVDPSLRARRAEDLAFYLQQLLGLDPPDAPVPRGWKELLERAQEEGAPPFLDLAAAVRRGNGPVLEPKGDGGREAEWAALEGRLRESSERLDVLAGWLESAVPTVPGEPGEPGEPPTSTPAERLVAELERARRSVEDATAAKLFAEATGFAPGRLEEETLLECFDHGWMAELLGWDDARLAEWARTVRAGWQQGWRDSECLPRLLWSLVHEPTDEPGIAEFLDRVSVVFEPEGALAGALEEGPTPWREVRELAVFAELPALFEARVPEEALRLGASALPILLEDLRAGSDDGRLLPAGAGAGSFRALLEKSLAGRRQSDVERVLGLASELVSEWDRRYQETLRRALEEVQRAARGAELGARAGLVLAAEARDRAAERAEFFLKDYGKRPRPLASGELTYDVVYLLTRHELDFPGFRVSERCARELVLQGGDDLRPADRLVGRVSAPSLDDLLRQSEAAQELRTLQRRADREQEEEEELRRLLGEVRRPDQAKGVSGIEAFFDAELAGRNGFSETRGLQDVYGVGGQERVVRAPEDGEDVVLTLDVDLETAAQRSLRDPAPAEDPKFDFAWAADPVGAIVLLSIDGEVLAAASEPDDQAHIGPEAQGQRLLATLERTLKKPTFQPPGSVIKPFVAAWALDHGLDRERAVVCGPIERGGSGYKDLRCWNTSGHGEVRLEEALERSCNAYFAWLGETIRTEEFQELLGDFGFGEPTGVRRAPPWDDDLGVPRKRAGLSEDRAGFAAGSGELSEALRRMAANGLGVVEATPMQLARAMLALATGEKRELTLVKRVGERVLPAGARAPLPIGRASLAFVRAAMEEVARDPQGTAHNALSPAQLGFSVAVKTGSADLESRRDREEKPVYWKHAWVAGWAPARDPKLVFVVFQHRTLATSSHGAVYLARQLLHQPEVLAWLEAAGVDVSGVPDPRPDPTGRR